MNELIADILAQFYIDTNFISRTAGCVQTISLAKKDSKTLKIPAARFVYTSVVPGETVCLSADDYYPMIPNSQEIGIMYFEDLGAKSTANNRRFTTWEGQLKMVCWLNMKKIGLGNGIGDLSGAILSSIPSQIAQSNNIYGGTLKASQMYPKRPSPFDQYDYNEAQTQFLTHPYDYFSIQIKYIIRVGVNCPLPISVVPIPC